MKHVEIPYDTVYAVVVSDHVSVAGQCSVKTAKHIIINLCHMVTQELLFSCAKLLDDTPMRSPITGDDKYV